MKLILAGGGTGGHLFPAIALAQEFKERDETCNILFIGSKKGLEAKVLSRYGFELKTLDVEGIKRKGLFDKFISLCKAGTAVWQSRKIIKMFNPDFVIGTGGYSAFPTVMAAKVMRIKTAILEQNALPGAANRFLGRFVDKVFIAFPETVKFFPEANVMVSGNPVRKEILRVRESESQRVKGQEFTILVFGGSQGANAVNSMFLESLEYLKHCSINVIHQTGDEDYERVKEAYKKVKSQNAKVKSEVHKFIDDMAGAYKEADLIICRSGATSIAEITALGLASILIPYPYAADNHQEINARCLSDKGAAVMMRQAETTGKKLADEVIRLYENRAELKDMEGKALSLAKHDAGKMIVEECCKMVSNFNDKIQITNKVQMLKSK